MGSESGRLFVERAAAVSGDFELTEKNAAAVMEVVTRLDGIPLAIELAAARVGVLSPSQIAQRLDQRFRLLAGGTRGAIERHATLRAAVDWSFDLLDAAEQRLLARLSIFAGGCTLDAAEAVCSDDVIAAYDVLDLLSTLGGTIAGGRRRQRPGGAPLPAARDDPPVRGGAPRPGRPGCPG